MALKANSSETNTKISKSGIASLLKYFVFDKNLALFSGLVVIYTFVELIVSPILTDFLTKEEKHELIVAAIRVTNLRDVLSSIFSIVVFPITEAFSMITICTAANILGLVLLWTSTSPSAHVEVYAAIFLLALGKTGQKLSEKFFQYLLRETSKPKEESEVERGSIRNKDEQDRAGEIRKHVWLVIQSFSSYSIIIVHIALINPDGDYKERFLFAAILMFVMYVLFVIGDCGWYSRKVLAAETESNEVREVKSLVPITCICFTFVAYSLILASGNTFFVVQARRLTPFTKSIGNDISSLFLIKSVVKTMSKYTCMGLSFVSGRFRKFKDLDARSKRKAGTITKTCCGMVCAVLCSLISMLVVLIIQPHKTVDLVPQFLLLGITEGLVGEGFANLLHDHVPKWMWSFEDSISELMIGTGKIIVLIICILFKDAVNPSHLGRFYLVLAILNAAFLLVYACISIRYAYKKEATVENTLELHVRQPDSQDSCQENNNRTQPVDQGGNTHTTTSDKFELVVIIIWIPLSGLVGEDPPHIVAIGSDYHLEPTIHHKTTQHDVERVVDEQVSDANSQVVVPLEEDTEGSNKNIPPKRLEALVNPIDTLSKVDRDMSVQPAQVEYSNDFNKHSYPVDDKITKEKTLELQPDSQRSYPENNDGTQPVDQVESHATPPVRVSTKESRATAAADPLGEETHTGISDMCELYVSEDPLHLVAAADPSGWETHLEPTIQHDMVGMVVEQVPDANDQVLVPMH